MNSFADKQTLEDLNLTGRFKKGSILRFYDNTVTPGGSKLLEEMFQNPLRNADEINKRKNIFELFTNHPVSFPFTQEEFNTLQNYLLADNHSNMIGRGMQLVLKKVLQVVAKDKDYLLLKTQCSQSLALLHRFKDFVFQLPSGEGLYQNQLLSVRALFTHKKLQRILLQDKKELSFHSLTEYDHLLKNILHEPIKQMIEFVYQLDVYISVAGIAANYHFAYANALPKTANLLAITDVYHPAIKNAVGNSLVTDEENNVMFLTGANMAGKSTLMKSIGIAVYLAHIGFPVAAKAMEFSVKDGLYSSINISDSINLGHSHFYAEVLRVKKVAEEVAAGKDLVVIFDELFKGTNVKDAYDATLSIIEAFAEIRDCFFIISTHIIEVAEALQKHTANFRFSFLPTLLNGLIPQYTYKLAEGITTDRQGMMIINNEKIIELIMGS